jgi:hypothetical protein
MCECADDVGSGEVPSVNNYSIRLAIDVGAMLPGVYTKGEVIHGHHGHEKAALEIGRKEAGRRLC